MPDEEKRRLVQISGKSDLHHRTRMKIKRELEKLRRNSIRLEIEGAAELVTGGTRFGGVPDVPADFVWPIFETDAYDDVEVKPRALAFLAQFNCMETAPFDKENLLPKTGLLSLQNRRLLFPLDTVDAGDLELMFGDCGRIYFYIRKEDLPARRFERVWLVLQCS